MKQLFEEAFGAAVFMVVAAVIAVIVLGWFLQIFSFIVAVAP